MQSGRRKSVLSLRIINAINGGSITSCSPGGLYGKEMPAFVIGTVRWDNWLLWKAFDLKLPVVDASDAVLALHQNHDYSYHPQGKKGVLGGSRISAKFGIGGRGEAHAHYFTRHTQAHGRWPISRYMAAQNEVRNAAKSGIPF